MSTSPPAVTEPTLPAIPWFWFILIGIICTVLGILGLGMTVTLTFISIEVYGFLLIMGGASHIVGGLFARPWSNAMLHGLSGMLYLLAGVFVVTEPLLVAGILTLLLSIALIVGGALRIVLAFQHRRVLTWLGLALGGLVTMLVGIYIFRRWPWDSVWVIGLFLAIDLFVQGLSWIALGLNLRVVDQSRKAGLPMEFKTKGDSASGQ